MQAMNRAIAAAERYTSNLAPLAEKTTGLATYLYLPTLGALAVVTYAFVLETGVSTSSTMHMQMLVVLGMIMALALALALWRAKDDVLYYAVVGFNRVVVNLYFRKLDTAGNVDAIPSQGPVLLIGNHQNQFMDGLLLTALAPRKVRLLTAAKSLHRPIVGSFAKGLGCIPVTRPKDVAFVGSGSLRLDTNAGEVIGSAGASFSSELAPGSSIATKAFTATVVEVLADDRAKVSRVAFKGSAESDENVKSLAPAADTPAAYKVIPKLDHSQMFSEVFEQLASGECVGLFPEGGSHDNTHLLPLKAGVALMALGALEKFPDLAITIVPVGFHYYAGSKFRSKAVVNYGDPLVISGAEWRSEFASAKRETVGKLLGMVEDALRSVTLNVPDEDFLDFVLVTKRLYTPPNVVLTPSQNLELTRRFAVGLQREDLLHDEAILDVRRRVAAYADLCRRHGYSPMSATSVATRSLYGLRAIPYLVVVATASLLALVPGIVLNMPVGLLARSLAHAHAAKAKAESSVKLHGRDVIASYKLIVGVVAMPIWFITVLLGLLVFSPLTWTQVVILAFLMPLYSWVGVMFTEQTFLWSKSVYPLLLRILPSYRAEEAVLARMRNELAGHIRQLIEDYDKGGFAENERIVPLKVLQGADDYDGWIEETN
ncbi:glycerol-3-phosphate acyltransferase [Thecamonas trahens ATCC 50062]|uniref:Glycerol-3-phosphate acyltransferase n=1 Tax=Thecamonas trahens ATCC 50062 TaxID=461836 RepID=A0A0L0DC13_THETB|nr:glycerol-3-phosphate acyltransferase [Thecamonas trahens ATCC 50062]KNC48848.1 glycerol-3-phosphate acyltransferase [Thecamonas trahens ATCC 50062]|eukprot:XP_013758268.1 glycerol-3-phosphate acyltransferase [Thecamonas trahens ATCC 50062]